MREPLCDPDGWLAAAAHGLQQEAEELLAQGTHIDSLHPLIQTTALMEACRHGHVDMAAWLLSRKLPARSTLAVASSMPVRDLEYVACPGDAGLVPRCNRGANGIDGTLSTACGLAHGADAPVTLLTGDLAFLHDSNGLLLRPKLRGSLTVVLVNNRGGGIFGHLPVAAFEPPFEEFFATPQDVDFAALCAAHGVKHTVVRDWGHLEEIISVPAAPGIRVLEVRTDRKLDAARRKEWFAEIAAAL